jgi:fucose permease
VSAATVSDEVMHPNARVMPIATSVMVGLLVGSLAGSALVAAFTACAVLALITVISTGGNR